mgnify:FL=1
MPSNILVGSFGLPDSFIDYINGADFPWNYVHRSTSDGLSFMGHTLVCRKDENEWKPNSEHWPTVYKAFAVFCDQNNIEFTEIERCAINMTFARPDYPCSDAHVDKTTDHKVLLVYLNSDCTGDTIIYSDTYKQGTTGVAFFGTKEFNDLNEIKRISPVRDKAVVFDGAYYHAAEFPVAGQRRLVLVANFK